MNNLYRLKIAHIFKCILNQEVSFWIILLYLIIEYLRPQSMYPSIDIVPWGNIVLGAALIFTVYEKKLFKVKNRTNLYITIFFSIIIISSFLAISPKTSFENLKNFYLLYIIYFLIQSVLDKEEKIFIFICLFILISLKLSQAVFIKWVLRGFAYDMYGAAVGLGWLKNSGELAIQLCISFAISFYMIKAIWAQNKVIIRIVLSAIPIIFLGGIIACGSRGSYLACAVVLLFIFLQLKHKVIGIIIIILAFAYLPHILSERDINRTVQMGEKGDRTAIARLERWDKGLKMTKQYPLFGVGFENWGIADKKLFNGTGAECHNIFIECISELGIIGLLGFLMLIYTTYKNNIETYKLTKNQNDMKLLSNLALGLNLSMLAYIVAGSFVTVLYYPYFWVNLAMTVSLNNIAKKNIIKD